MTFGGSLMKHDQAEKRETPMYSYWAKKNRKLFRHRMDDLKLV